MGWTGSGTFSSTTSGIPVVTATTISSTVQNNWQSELDTGLTNCIAKDGQSATTARIPFASGVGLGNGTVAAPALNFTNDTGCGFYRIGSANIGFAIGGTKVWDIVAASVTLSQNLICSTVYGGTGATSTLTLAGSSSGSPTAAHIILNSGMVGGKGCVAIGTATPRAITGGFLAVEVRGHLDPANGEALVEIRSDSGTAVSMGAIQVSAVGASTFYMTMGDASVTENYITNRTHGVLATVSGIGIKLNVNATANSGLTIASTGATTIHGALTAASTAVITTSLTTPIAYGGSAAGSVLLLQSTSNGSPSGDRVDIQTANFVYRTTAGTQGANMAGSTSTMAFNLNNRDLGNDVQGCMLMAGRNSSGGAVGPAAGVLKLVSADNTNYFLWVDAVGKLRIHTSAPTGSSGAPTVSDTAGTIVGTQA